MGMESQHPWIPLPENEFAYAAAERLLLQQDSEGTNLVYLHGPPGVGKSELLLHLLERLLNQFDGVQYRIISLYEYATLMMEAARGEGPDPNETLANLDLLLLEDLQHLDGQQWIQKKLIQLLNLANQNGSRVVVTSQWPVGEFTQLYSKLISRFHGGVTASILLPGEHSRISLLHHFAERHKIFLPTAAAQMLARELAVSPRELQGSIVQLAAIQRLQQEKINIEAVQELLELQQPRRQLTLTDISRAVAKEFGVKVQSMRSAGREKSLLVPRQVAMFLARQLMEAQYATIGEYFGGRSHSTVLHACKTLEKKLQLNPELDLQLCQIRRTLQGFPSRKPH